ncbi:alpha/beta fold hydrolase [Nonomuraea sp. NPDC050451]|uniref:alpha/beta fold hydrolase n=1 Tax=Nonomuraea sp. NPDC050451 TaxID=3364364 RepID=UPI0037B40CB3
MAGLGALWATAAAGGNRYVALAVAAPAPAGVAWWLCRLALRRVARLQVRRRMPIAVTGVQPAAAAAPLAGLSSRLSDVGGYTVARHVADLDAVRATIGADRVVLAGVSWGGQLVAAYLAAHPDRVARAVVASPGTMWSPAFPDNRHLTESGLRDQNRALWDHYPRLLLAAALVEVAGPRAAHALLPDEAMDGEFESFVGELDLRAGCPGRPLRVPPSGSGFWANVMTAREPAGPPTSGPRCAGSPCPCWCCAARATTWRPRSPASTPTCCRTPSSARSTAPATTSPMTGPTSTGNWSPRSCSARPLREPTSTALPNQPSANWSGKCRPPSRPKPSATPPALAGASKARNASHQRQRRELTAP